MEFAPSDAEVTLRGWFIPTDTPRATLIFLHGHNDNREEDGDFLALAGELGKRGFNILLFDLRGHGASGGDRVSYGFFERNDLKGAFDYRVGRGVAPDSIGVFGMSMGAGTALLGAAEVPSIRALVADSPYARETELVVEEIRRKTPVPKWVAPVFVPGGTLVARLLYGIDIGELAPEESVARLDYPVFVIHGTADTRIPFEHGLRVHAAAPTGSEFWSVPDVDHTDAFPAHPEEYADRVARYFEERLVRE